jgi:hypothetical protein
LDSLVCTGWCVKLLRRPEPVRHPVERTFFHRLAKFAMRRAIPVPFVGAALLSALGCRLLRPSGACPTKTLAVVRRLNDWMTGRHNAITAVVVTACGVLLVVTGMGKM